ncbi:MAG: phosphodiester glycosidase family protein [Myxococcota bacterium]|nr:phosphodiester glycosidase family protein [Myxococcota bacterium]
MNRIRSTIVCAVALACALPFAAGGQTDVRGAEPGPSWTSLGRGVEHLALASGSIQGHAFRFRPAEVEMRVVPAAEGHARVAAIAPAQDAIATNASFFDEAGKTMGLAVDRGRSLGGRRISRWAAFVVDGASARIVAGATLEDVLGHDLVLQGLPRLVVGGAVPRLKPQRAERTAVCVEDARVVLVVTTSRVDATEFARFLAGAPDAGGLGCRDALNFDGGSSTQLAAHWGTFEATIDGAWGVPNALVVTPRTR